MFHQVDTEGTISLDGGVWSLDGKQERRKKMSKKLVTQDVKEKNLMPVTCVANNVLQDHINIHTGENHMCVQTQRKTNFD